VFLPFLGCPGRCVYCAQDLQTGKGNGDPQRVLRHALRDLSRNLPAAVSPDAPLELAFYGGTFTALPDPWLARFLALARELRGRGLVTRVRCSTRPDAVDEPLLRSLRRQGLDMVELGVQSFRDEALQASGRGYTGERARRACTAVRAAGLSLGVQLMPGLPGQDAQGFLEDVEDALAAGPDAVRLYPCVVLRGTPLARRWLAGEYAPWPLEGAVWLLGRALLRFWSRGIPVIRVGLAPEPGLADNILAGPVHPALGLLARSQALHAFLRARLEELGRPVRLLRVPRPLLPVFWGHGREMAPAWARLGLDRAARPWDRPLFLLR
jgi:histone acetyltransferase (RNA polymerase elongator complex component)